MLVALLIVVMLAALIGMMVCNKQKNNPVAQPIAFGLLLLVVVCGGVLMWKLGVFGSSGALDRLRANETKFFASQGFVVGQDLKGKFEGKTVILVEPTTKADDPRIVALIEQYKAGLGNNSAEVVVVPITVDMPESEPGSEPPLTEVMKAKDYDAFFAAQPDAKVVITLVGFPRDLQKMKFWTTAADKRPLLFLLGSIEGRGLAAAVKSDAIAGIVTIGSNARFTEEPAPSDPLEAFKVRYVLINKANVEENKGLLGE